MELKGKKVAVLGAGGSGFAAAALAISHGATVAAYDSGDVAKLALAVDRFAEIGVVLTCGEEALSPGQKFDVTVVSPGIDERWPIAQAFIEVSDEFIGEIELAYRLSDIPVIAITGTNGKTTTTSLITDMINGGGKRAVAAGNIGRPYSDVVLSGESSDWIVLEVSSFQLETICSFSPEVAVWMNFAPDHLDRYDSLEDYRQAKLRIFENGGEGRLAICKLEDSVGGDWQRETFSSFSEGGDFRYEGGMIHHDGTDRRFDFSKADLQGKHNAENVMAALAVADHIGLEWSSIEEAVLSFKAPAHRCEKVGEFDGVLYLNDSKSTNLHSLESALAGQENPIVLIAGGKQKGLNFGQLTELVREKVKSVISIGEIADDIAKLWSPVVECRVASDLSEAARLAADEAERGDIVLFSPGTSSFDMFSGYEARGEAFKGAVNHLHDA
ncbi:MAG: UDP-N-acetylmuramoyl-L-alanine--D-glutamate ligase [Verrucomicrobiales bacterium]|nr:UDP-N-acetylmuramoyl-L-alanine--D-glutamate ligase [Verrucomicrobiales bacterium]